MKTTLAATTFMLLSVSTALAFGTIRGMGQDAEHERITRHARPAKTTSRPTAASRRRRWICLPAGRARSAPWAFPIAARSSSRPKPTAMGRPLRRRRLSAIGTDARARLQACRDWMAKELDAAVEAAGDLLDGDGQIRDSEVPDHRGVQLWLLEGLRQVQCTRAFRRPAATPSQDFYSHTNWTDKADTSQPVSPTNPPGLAKKRGPSPWIDLRADSKFPDGLVSGCFETASAISEAKGCNYGPKAAPRVKHFALNKDKGPIDPAIGEGKTDRGRINANFRNAVEAAIAATRATSGRR